MNKASVLITQHQVGWTKQTGSTYTGKPRSPIPVHRGIDKSVLKTMINDQKRHMRGRWYSGKKDGRYTDDNDSAGE